MCSGLRKIIEDASSPSHRLNISELHSSITMINLMKGLFTMLTNYERETYFSFNEAQSEAVMFTHNASIIRKYKNAMCEYPEIKLVRENEDGSCQFIMPKKWFAPRLPAKLTPEQRAAYVERGKKLAKLLHGT